MSGLAIGAAVPPLRVTLTRECLIRYAGAADDYVRQHWDHPFMIDSGFPDVVAHGWLTFAHMAPRSPTGCRRRAGGSPGSRCATCGRRSPAR